ncbi:actin-related protein 2/3 complex subunit 5-B [Epargyreus clarus]|uniref:actin-related protein 2/3 complex subunit 5-B n=1 Tax=Epargyreus clarus TaxID=520877 RepID=UPI003C2AFC67
MAKNTSSSAFRKIDIDQYNEDNFKEDEAEQSAPTGPDEGEVCALLNQGRYVEALKLVLSNAPLGTTDQQIKDSALALTLKVLLAIKSAQIEEVVGTLSRDDIDVLMKYIYRGFEYPSEGSSGHLLLWHEKAYNIGGSGSIVRVLSDRMKV